MPEEFEGDLAGAVFWGADLTEATFRDVNLTGASISHAWLIDVNIDALVERVVINGVDVTDFVNQHDEWYPLRAMLRPATPAAMLDTWRRIEAEWATTMAAAQALPSEALDTRVDDEFSFVQTLRHLVFATDKWLTVPVLGGEFHPAGLPNTGSLEFPFPGLDLATTPPHDEVFAVRADRMASVGAFLAALGADRLDDEADVLENGPHPIRECVFTVFEEEFWHLRYARRDLAML